MCACAEGSNNDPCSNDFPGTAANSVLETQAVSQFLQASSQITRFISIHSSATPVSAVPLVVPHSTLIYVLSLQALVYSPAYSTELPPDNDNLVRAAIQLQVTGA